MPAFKKHHEDDILQSFENRLAAFGFRRKRKGQFIRDGEDGLTLMISVDVSKAYGELRITPALSVMHYELGTLVSEALARTGGAQNQTFREFDAELMTMPLSFVVGYTTGTQTTADYAVKRPDDIQKTLHQIYTDFSEVHDGFFETFGTLPSLISQFAIRPRLGGMTHSVKLMALYVYTKQPEALQTFAANISPDTTSPLILNAKAILMKKMSLIDPVADATQASASVACGACGIPDTPEEQLLLAERMTEFETALKTLGDRTDWQLAQSVLFREQDDWFISNTAELCPNGGICCRWSAKPMAIDPLFWDIIGLPEDDNPPLSLRVLGGIIIRPPFRDFVIHTELTAPTELAQALLDWSDQTLIQKKPTMTMEYLLNRLGTVEKLNEDNKRTAICLLILLDRLDEAYTLAQSVSHKAPVDSFTSHQPGRKGPMNFFSLAQNWIVNKRRSGIALI